MKKRKRKRGTRKVNTCDNFGQAAEMLGVAVSVVREAKKRGCPAFRSGRIYFGELREWLGANQGKLSDLPTGDRIALAIMAQRLRRLTMDNDVKSAKWVEREKVQAAIVGTLTQVRSILRQRLEDEYPSKVAGLDVPQAQVYGKRVTDEILTSFERLKTHWTI